MNANEASIIHYFFIDIYLHLSLLQLGNIYQPPANAAGLCWAWDCKQHGQKHHQKQQQQQQHHSLHCQQHGEKHHQKQQQQQQQPTAAITTAATTTTATTTATTTTTPAATTTTATTTTTRTRTRTRTTATATATRAAAAAATAGSQQLTANSQQEQQHRRGPRGNRARDLLDVWWSWCLWWWWWWWWGVGGGGGGVILGEVKARPKDISSFSLDYIGKSKVQTSNPSSSPIPLDTPARPADFQGAMSPSRLLWSAKSVLIGMCEPWYTTSTLPIKVVISISSISCLKIGWFYSVLLYTFLCVQVC